MDLKRLKILDKLYGEIISIKADINAIDEILNDKSTEELRFVGSEVYVICYNKDFNKKALDDLKGLLIVELSKKEREFELL